MREIIGNSLNLPQQLTAKYQILSLTAPLYCRYQSGSGDARAKVEVRTALQGVSEWFDDYLSGEQGDGLDQVSASLGLLSRRYKSARVVDPRHACLLLLFAFLSTGTLPGIRSNAFVRHSDVLGGIRMLRCSRARCLFACPFLHCACAWTAPQEPELHKSMLLLLARAWDYKVRPLPRYICCSFPPTT